MSDHKNILYVHQYFHTPNENGSVRSFDLSTYFSKHNYFVKILTTHNNLISTNLFHKRFVGKIEVHSIRTNYNQKLPYVFRGYYFLKFILFFLVKILIEKQKFILLASSTPITVGIACLIGKKIKNFKTIFEVRDVWPEAILGIGLIKKNSLIYKTLHKLEKIIYMNSDRIVTLSSGMKDSINSNFKNRFKSKIFVIENISNLKRFKSTKNFVFNKNDFVKVVYCGTIGKVNGLHYLIKLAKGFLENNKNIIFNIYGDGNEKNELISLAKKYKTHEKNVFFNDPVSKDDLKKVYSNSHFGSSFVINSRVLWNNSANKFFDTLAASRLVLINHGGWQKDVIIDNNLGIALNEEIDFVNFDLVYDNMLKLIKSERINKKILNFTKENYSLSVLGNKYLKIFNSL